MSREPRHYAQEMFGGLPPDEFLRPGSPLKSTAEDRATLGPSWQQMPAHGDWDSNGWANGHPIDQTDYTMLHRDGALRGDFVRATYYATLLLLQEQRALVEQQQTANEIRFMNALPETSPIRNQIRTRIEKGMGL